jgi:hypothetical protein
MIETRPGLFQMMIRGIVTAGDVSKLQSASLRQVASEKSDLPVLISFSIRCLFDAEALEKQIRTLQQPCQQSGLTNGSAKGEAIVSPANSSSFGSQFLFSVHFPFHAESIAREWTITDKDKSMLDQGNTITRIAEMAMKEKRSDSLLFRQLSKPEHVIQCPVNYHLHPTKSNTIRINSARIGFTESSSLWALSLPVMRIF